MPLYEYKCENCGWSGERIVRIADRDRQFCPGALYERDGGINLDLDDHKLCLVWNYFVAADHQIDMRCAAKLDREEVSLTAPHRADTRFQMQAITSDGKKVDGNFGGGIRRANPIFKSGLAPSKADQRKHAHKAYKKNEKHYPGRKKAEKKK